MNDWKELVQPTTQWVVGADEVGTGAYAGPVYVCAVRVPVAWVGPPGLTTDSKKLTPSKREVISDQLRPVERSIQIMEPKDIDALGLSATLQRLFADALKALYQEGDLVILDGLLEIDELNIPHVSFPNADEKVPAIRAASVIAKVARDRKMVELGRHLRRG